MICRFCKKRFLGGQSRDNLRMLLDFQEHLYIEHNRRRNLEELLAEWKRQELQGLLESSVQGGNPLTLSESEKEAVQRLQRRLKESRSTKRRMTGELDEPSENEIDL